MNSAQPTHPTSLPLPSPQTHPAPKAERANKSADYFLYRHIPTEQPQCPEPLSDRPDNHNASAFLPLSKGKERVLTPAPCPETPNFFEDLPVAVKIAPVETRDIEKKEPPVARISVLPESVGSHQQIRKRTYYIPLTSREGQQAPVYFFQNNSPPESFFNENKPISAPKGLQMKVEDPISQIQPLFAQKSAKEKPEDPSHAHIAKKFQIINAFNRIETDIKVMAIELKRQETKERVSALQLPAHVEDKVRQLNQLLALKTEIGRQASEIEGLVGLEQKEKANLTMRADDLREQIDLLISQRNTSFAQNLNGKNAKLSESIVAQNASPFPRISYNPNGNNGEQLARVVSKSTNISRDQNPVFLAGPLASNGLSRPFNFRESIPVSDFEPTRSEICYFPTLAEGLTNQNPQLFHTERILVQTQQTRPAPQIIRYSYNPGQVLNQIPVSTVVQISQAPTDFFVQQNPQILQKTQEIKESATESYDSRFQRSNVPGQRFSLNPSLHESRNFVIAEPQFVFSGRSVPVEGSLRSVTQQSNRTFEKSGVPLEQLYSMTNVWPDGPEFFEGQFRQSATHKVNVPK